jgi:hypothetical protein
MFRVVLLVLLVLLNFSVCRARRRVEQTRDNMQRRAGVRRYRREPQPQAFARFHRLIQLAGVELAVVLFQRYGREVVRCAVARWRYLHVELLQYWRFAESRRRPTPLRLLLPRHVSRNIFVYHGRLAQSRCIFPWMWLFRPPHAAHRSF